MKKQKRSKKLKKLILLIYVMFLLSIILTNGLSKYRTTYGNEVSAKIAKPIIEVKTDPLTIENVHNEEVVWNFSVNNYLEEEVNQVALSYKIKIGPQNLQDLQYELYKIENETETKIKMSTDGISEEDFNLSNTEIQEDKYCLKIKTGDDVPTFDTKGIKVETIATQLQPTQQGE